MNDMRKFIRLLEDCDETPEQGEDGECSPFTHADDNVDMVREEDFEPLEWRTCPECGDESMDLQDSYGDEFFYVCNTCGAEMTDSLSRTVIGEPPAPEDELEEDDDDDYHEAEVRRFMDMGKRDLWILYNDTLEDNDPEDHDALQYMHHALRQMGVHVAEDYTKEDFLIPPKDAKYDAEVGEEDDEDYDPASDPLLRGGEDGLGPDGHGYDRIPEEGPGDEDDFDADPDAMVDVGDDEDYEEFDFDDEFERMMGNTNRFESVEEINHLRKMAGLEQVNEDRFPNMKEWWNEDPDEIMSMIYWQKGQLPPSKVDSKSNAWERNWFKVAQNLAAKYPPPAEYEMPVKPEPMEQKCSRCDGRGWWPANDEACFKCDGKGTVVETMGESTDSQDDYVAFEFDDEKAYYLVADECGEMMDFGMRDECLIPEQWVDQVIALLTDHGFEKGKAYTMPGMDEDLQNGYNDRAMSDGEDYFPKGATSSPARELGPAGAKHGDNPMRTPMASVDKNEDDIYESYKHQYRRFRRK